MGIFLTKGGGNGGSTPTPTPTEIKLYSEDDSIEVIQEFDENDNPTGWTNIERKNDLASEELEVGARVFLNFAEEDIVKKQQTYILSTNNGRKIEVTISGKYTIESLDDMTISVSGDVEDDDSMWVYMYTDPGDENGNRYQGYFFIIYFGGPYQWTQDDDEAFYVSANSDKSLINWMWNGLSAEAYERLEEVDNRRFYLFEYTEGEKATVKSVNLYVVYDSPEPDYLFKRPAILQNNELNFADYALDRDAPSETFFRIKYTNANIINGVFTLNATFKDSGLREILGFKETFEPNFFLVNYNNSPSFCSYLKSFNPQEQNFPFVFQVSINGRSLDCQNFFRETAIQNGFIPRTTIPSPTVDIRSMFYYCQHMTNAHLKNGQFHSLYRTFKGCNLLEDVTIEQTTEGLYNQEYISSLQEAFYGCSSLQTIHFIKCKEGINSSLNFTDAFTGCNSLTEIILERCSEVFITEIQNNAPAGVTVTVINYPQNF